MAEYRLSRRAAVDLQVIAEFTIERSGVERARRYRDDLKTRFAELAARPTAGQRAEQFAPGLRRFEYQSHIIFYQQAGDGIFIVRILHSRMDVMRHL